MRRSAPRSTVGIVVLSTLFFLGCSRNKPTGGDQRQTDALAQAQAPVTASCRSFDLQASRSTHPTTSSDGVATEAPSFGFKIPSTLPVTAGASWHGTATLSFSVGSGAVVSCTYHGNAPKTDHGVNNCGGAAYVFGDCSNGAHAGDVAEADHFTLHVESSCEKAPTTTIDVVLAEEQPCGGNNLCTGVVCSPLDQCHAAGTCDPSTGQCSDPAKADGATCNDGNVCTTGDVCRAGVCGGTAITCTALDQCHSAGTCDPSTGQCSNPTKADGSTCNDGNGCTTNDVCTAGVCGGTAVTCTALDQCHSAGTCDPSTGQCSNPTKADGTTCNDGNACTTGDVCAAGVCGGTAVTCAALDQCHSPGTCNPSTGQCSNPTKADGTSCSDGNACTTNDVCKAGVCGGTAITCTALDQCHSAGTCDPSSGTCSNPTKADGTSCNDGNACSTSDVCTAGSCGGTPITCSASDACHVAGTCDPSTGSCSNPPATSGTTCGGNVCTGISTCDASGTCQPGTPPVLVNTACETQTCDPVHGIVTTLAAAGTTCGGNACSGISTCDGAGTCTPGTPVIVASTNPCVITTCDPTTGAVTTANASAGTSCASSTDKCSAADTCDGNGTCVLNPAPGLDDGIACTIDYCDPTIGVVHTPCSPLDPTVTTTMADSLAFLYRGAKPIQTGVAPGTIDFVRAAGIQGHVVLPDGTPAMLARVKVVGHPEFGQTVVDGHGDFIIAVNGGGTLTVDVAMPGFLPGQRAVQVPWNDYARVSNLTLVDVDPNATFVDLTAQTEMAVARGSVMTDDAGSRQGTLLIPTGTTAAAVMPDGTTKPLGALTLHVTEYTVGNNGLDRMPADLPPTNNYTYAAEVTVEEANAAGATHVQFNQAIPYYFENFYGFPVGTIIPVGSYDQQQGIWVGDPNGVVIQILGTSGGVATIDASGNGVPESAATLASLGITPDEQQTLAMLYAPGTQLWRAAVSHFSTVDLNFKYIPAAGSCPPDGCDGKPHPLEADNPNPDPQCSSGSVVECDNGIVGERIGVAGTGIALSHWSDRTPGYVAARHLTVPFTESVVPSVLQSVEVTVDVGGQRLTKEQTCPCAPDQFFEAQWDGNDQFGRAMVGAQEVTITHTYVYPAVYATSATAKQNAWAQFGASLLGNPTFVPAGHGVAFGLPPQRLIRITKKRTAWLGEWDNRGEALGGWTLSNVHSYDILRGQLLRGDGSRRTDHVLPSTIHALATAPPADGFGTHVAALPDGSIAYEDDAVGLVRQLRDGSIHPLGVAGSSGRLRAGADGSIYFEPGEYIQRWSPDGTVTSVAGYLNAPNTGTDSGDGGPAVAAIFKAIESFAVADDGTIYIGESGRIRRVGTDGIINTVLGDGTYKTDVGDGGPAISAKAADVTAMIVGDDGSLYFADDTTFGVDVIRRIAPDGIVHLVAGNPAGNVSDAALNGVNERTAVFYRIADLARAPDGTIYVLSAIPVIGGPSFSTRAVRAVTPDGEVNTIAGRYDPACPGTGFCDEAGAAANAQIATFGISLAPDGRLYLADTYRILQIRSALPSPNGPGTISVPEADGSSVYVFNAHGKHLRTIDSTTNTVLYQMAYDANGLLSSITDRDGLVTTIQRDPNGQATAIVAPFGQTTTLTTGVDGYLARVTDPDGGHWDITYQNGQISTFTNRDGHTSTITYDANGRLLEDLDPGGGFQSEARTDFANGTGWSVTRTTAMGRATTYQTSFDAAGVEHRATTEPDGLTTTTTRDTANKHVSTLPDGEVVTFAEDKDPRFGILAPVGTQTEAQPSGLTRTSSTARAVTLSDPSNPLSVLTRTDTTTLNGQTWTSVYTTGTNVLTTTSPAGRTRAERFDTLGHVLEVDVPEVLPITFQYDAFGRLVTATQGTRVASATYGPDGFLATSTDPLHETTSLTRDLDGRVLSTQRPDLAVTGFSYNGEGNTTQVVPPGDPAHDFTFDNREMVSVYNPPNLNTGATPTSYAYNLDRQPTQTTQPGPRIISYGYDNAGRLVTTTIPTGTITRTYDSAGRLATLAGPAGVTMTLGYDGGLETSVAWSGAVSGSLTRTFDNNFRVSAESVNGAGPVAFSYDADSLLVGAGGLTIARDSQNGRVTGTTAGSVTDAYTYSPFGEVASYAADFGTTSLLSFGYTRDDLGRITDKNETDAAGTHAFHYSYDNVGRLEQVTEDGTLVESYSYDLNGNRTSSLNSAGVFSATFDQQDRILTYGNLSFAYTPNGELSSKTDTGTGAVTQYTHDALGNLTSIVLPSGTLIEYLVDGAGRRVGKRINGTLVKQWLWSSRLQPAAELDGAGNVVARFVYGVGANVPDLMVTSTATYRFVKDHLGSVRLVVDDATGTIAQGIVYDTWGRMLSDSSPGFQPFAFGGGLYDPDTGLVRFGARDYDAETGKWTIRDPIGLEGGLNSTAYVGNEPVNGVDLSGLIGPWDSQTSDRIIGSPVDWNELNKTPAMQGLYAGSGIMVGGLALVAGGSQLGALAGLARWLAPFVPWLAQEAEDNEADLDAFAQQCGGEGVCFVAGTPVATEEGPVSIEELRVGDRVEAGNTACAADHVEADWVDIRLTLPNPTAPKDIMHVELLRPATWLEERGLGVTGGVWLELPEMSIEGWATVLSVGAPPPEKHGNGCLVTMTVNHVASELLRLRFAETSDALELTPVHRLYSESRGWVDAKDLAVGERVRTNAGLRTIAEIERAPGNRPVFNIEVEREHSYRVGGDGIWAHNECDPIHHVFPQEFRSQFEDLGIDIDEFGLQIPRLLHQGIHANDQWNGEWYDFFEGSPTFQGAMQLAVEMINRYGLTPYLPFVQY